MSLSGNIIPRRVQRMFDQRHEPRHPVSGTAEVEWRGTRKKVAMGDLSASGAMLIWDDIPCIGETVSLSLPGQAAISGTISWVRSGRVGIYFKMTMV